MPTPHFFFCRLILTGPDNAIDYIGPQDYTVTRHDQTARYWTAPNLYKRKRGSMLPLPDLTASHHTLPLQDNAKLHRYVNERNCIKLYFYCSETDSSWLHHYDTWWHPTKPWQNIIPLDNTITLNVTIECLTIPLLKLHTALHYWT